MQNEELDLADSECLAKGDESASPRPGPRFRWSWLAPWSPPGCLLLLFLGTAGFCLFVARQIAPPDWVDVKIAPLPEGCKALFILVERTGRIEALSPYVSKVTAGALHANYPTGVLGFNFGNDPDASSVQWKPAERFGVLIRFEHSRDLLWWLHPDEIDRPALKWFFGSSRAEIRIPPIDRAEVPTNELLDQLGLDRKFKAM
jgi:hypothetical protein